MNFLIGLSFVILVISYILFGLNMCTIIATITFLMFAGRKFGYFCKLHTVLLLEGIGLFIFVVFQLMIRRVNMTEWLQIIVVRGIALLIVYYDTKYYVYITEERRHDATDD